MDGLATNGSVHGVESSELEKVPRQTHLSTPECKESVEAAAIGNRTGQE